MAQDEQGLKDSPETPPEPSAQGDGDHGTTAAESSGDDGDTTE